MVKGSSASAGTRKKNQAKKVAKLSQTDPSAAADLAAQPLSTNRKGVTGPKLTKKDKAAQKVKRGVAKPYTPPPKPPAPAVPDPLESMGLSASLPGGLVVVLRKLGKKDEVTRRRALEDLGGWLARVKKEGAEEGTEGEKEEKKTEADEGEEQEEVEGSDGWWVDVIGPVWLHHLPSLLLTPRLTGLALQTHSHFLALSPQIVANTLPYLQDHQQRNVLGSWLVSSLQYQSSPAFLRSANPINFAGSTHWKSQSDSEEGEQQEAAEEARLDLMGYEEMITTYLEMSILEPAELWTSVFPPVVSFTEPAKGGKPQQGYRGRIEQGTAKSVQAKDDEADDSESEKAEREIGLRVAGLVGLGWVLREYPQSSSTTPFPSDLTNLLSSQALWTSLSSSTSAALGALQPAIRKVAWDVLRACLTRWSTIVRENLETIASVALESCWVEEDQGTVVSMLEPLLLLLTKYPESWEIDMRSNGDAKEGDAEEDKEDEDDEGSDDEDEEKEETGPDQSSEEVAVTPSSSKAFASFLDFLRSGCRGLPVEGYPILVVVLSTLPPSLFPLISSSLSTFFAALWSALPLLLASSSSSPNPSSPSSTRSFLAALMECNHYILTKRLKRGESEQDVQEAREMAAQQIEKAWVEGVAALAGGAGGNRRRAMKASRSGAVPREVVAGLREAAIVGKGLEKLAAQDQASGDLAWARIVSSTKALLTTTSSENSTSTSLPASKLPNLLSSFKSELSSSWTPRFADLVRDVAQAALSSIKTALRDVQGEVDENLTERVDLITELISSSESADVLREGPFADDLSSFINTQTPSLLSSIPSPSLSRLFVATLTWRPDAQSPSRESFASLTSALSFSSNLPKEKRYEILTSLLRTKTPLPPSLVDGDGRSLDDECASLETVVKDGKASPAEVGLLEAMLCRPEPFVSQAQADAVLHRILSSFFTAIRTILSTSDGPTSSLIHEATSILHIIDTYITQASSLDALLFLDGSALAFFDAAHVVPAVLGELEEEADVEQFKTLSKKVWDAVSTQSKKIEVDLSGLVEEGLKEKIGNPDCRVSPDTLLSAVEAASVVTLPSILPTLDAVLSLLRASSTISISPALAVTDPLVPQTLTDPSPRSSHTPTDSNGLTTLARQLAAIIAYISRDRSFIRDDPSWLWPFSYLSLVTTDELSVSRSSSHVFGLSISKDHLQSILQDCDSHRSYALSALASSLDSKWHVETIGAIGGGKASAAGGLTALLGDLVNGSKEGDIHASRALRDLLEGVLQYSAASAEDAEKWLMFGRTLQDKAPQASLALIYASKPLILTSPRLDRFQNELAADITGIRASSANTKGLKALRLLAAAAPPPESTAIFLPERRTVMVMQTLQGWMTSDEDDLELSEELDSRVAEMYIHLVPIAQNELGSHWDFVFDLLESNLEAASWDDPASLPFLAHTLRLLSVVRDLAASNKNLRELWNQRREASLSLVFGLFMTEPESSHSLPLTICRSMILELVEDLPLTTLTPDRFAPLCSLLRDPSADVQTTSYRLLQRMIHAKTQDLVVQVELASSAAATAEGEKEEDKVVVELPEELMKMIGGVVEGGKEISHSMQMSSFLLAWKLIFDSFEDASLRIKSSHIEQIRNSDLVAQTLLPTIFSLLGVGGQASEKRFDIGCWQVDEFVMEMYDPEEPSGLSVLAAYLYYKGLIHVPSLLRSWWLECKDRQLSMAVASLTSKAFSPVIIDHELSTLRDPTNMSELQDEALTVKILPAVNEVTAQYIVDEQPMEIAIRLPADYPLHGVEIKDIRRVGVTEAKWRAWLLAVQQVMTSRDGMVLDALTLFKRNVSLHFEGVVDCAICYSIISVTDRTLPNRSCKTCSNRFHGSCLYKWFNTSHSSSCPLCRSLF